MLAAQWRAGGGKPLDGVVAVDSQALASILRGGEPIVLRDGRKVPPSGLVDFLAVEQYRGLAASDPTVRRKDQLVDVARSAGRRLTTGGGSTRALVEGLTDAVRSGHVRMASDDAALRPGLERAGVDGALPRGEAPVAYPVVVNATGGKLDHFLARRLVYTAQGCDGPRRRSRIEVGLRNEAPATGLPPYLTIRIVQGKRQDSTTSAVTLKVYGTRGADLIGATLDGRPIGPDFPGTPFLANADEAGLPFWEIFLELPRGRERTLVLDLVEPVRPGPARAPAQPLARDLQRDVRVEEC